MASTTAGLNENMESARAPELSQSRRMGQSILNEYHEFAAIKIIGNGGKWVRVCCVQCTERPFFAHHTFNFFDGLIDSKVLDGCFRCENEMARIKTRCTQ